jgi:hypothetical protein
MDTGSPTNPFSSHLVEPKRGGFIFSGGKDLQDVINQLARSKFRGELVGPHGAGKSTLLTDIENYLAAAGRTVVRWQCSDRQRTLPPAWLSGSTMADDILIDGAERLRRGQLALVRAATRLRRQGLITTTHRNKGLGAAIPIQADPWALAAKVAALTGCRADELEPEIRRRLAAHQGNAREVLFELYAAHEASRNGNPANF